MPEGDTIYRTAHRLRQALQGRQVTGFSSSAARVPALGSQRLVGETVAEVESRGKHLLHWFQPRGLALHTHLGMGGSWHLYPRGQRWRKPARRARAVIEVDGWAAVCFSAPVCELLSRSQVERHPQLAALGPDALADDTDLAAARRRLDARAGWPIGDALLDQRVLAGIGNVYKSEVLFLHGIDPWTPVGEVPAAQRDAVLATAERLLKANARPGATARVTTGSVTTASRATGTYAHAGAAVPRSWVYGKPGRPCPRCRAAIRVARQGTQGRVTYWCPRCQGAGPRRGTTA